MSVSLVGASSGDVLKGTHSMNNDLTILLHSDVPPLSSTYKLLLEEKGSDITNRMIIKAARLHRSDFFENYTDLEIVEWVKDNGETSYKKFLPNDVKLEVLESGEKTKLPSSIIDGIMSVEEIQEALVKNGGKPTLALYWHIWDSIVTVFKVDTDNLDEFMPILDEGTITTIDNIDMEDKAIYNFNIGTQTLIITCSHSDKDVGKKLHLDKSILKLCGVDKTEMENCYEVLEKSTKYFTPAGYKSLLQKIVRVGARNVEIPQEKGHVYLDSKCVVVCVFVFLYNCAGSFVPDLRRYVTGKESALKRVAITIIEDSFIEDTQILVDMLAHALVAQKVKSFSPTKAKLLTFVKALIEAMGSRKYYNYDWNKTFHSPPNLYGLIGKSSWELSAYIVNVIGSFKSDINMVGSVDGAKEGMKEITSVSVVKSIDQHWQPNIIYLFPLELSRELSTGGSTPYAKLMSYMWDYSSSYNSRKHPDKMRESEKYKIVTEFQTRYHMETLYPKSINLDEYESKIVSYTLPQSYIASKVGITYFSSKGSQLMACLSTLDIYNICVTSKPSRDDKSAVVSVEQEDDVKHRMTERLKSKGINNVKLHINEEGEKYYTVGDKSSEDWLDKTKEIFSKPFSLEKYTSSEINRAKYLISTSSDILTMPSISRDGGECSKVEIGAYNILKDLSKSNPSILSEKNIGKFMIKDTYLLHNLLKERKEKKENVKTYELKDSINRKPFEHQVEALEDMKKRKRSFVWIPVGMGKTYIVASYISYLLSTGELPEYIFYTAPKSAFEAVKSELRMWGLGINVISPIGKDKNKWKVSKDDVNIIEHDHVRRIYDDLENYISSSLFIVDEVHKTLAQTQRSNVILNLASLSSYFVVMTGTPMINNKMELLINWLRMCVDYPIDKRTFWIAISSLISKQVNTGVKVNKEVLYFDLSSSNEEKFDKLVGRSLGGTNDKVTSQDVTDAFDIAYETISLHMAKYAVSHVEDGVFIVAKDSKHQQKLKELILREGRGKICESEIGLMTKDKIYNLPDIDSTDNGIDVKIVITTKRMSEGYNLTKFGTMLTSVYFSNLATRDQLEGRINRKSQVREEIDIFVFVTRLLREVLNNYNYVSSISNALKMIAA